LFEQREIKGNAANLMQLSAPGLRALFLFVHLTVERVKTTRALLYPTLHYRSALSYKGLTQEFYKS